MIIQVQGRVYRHVMAALRSAREPPTRLEIARQVIDQRKIPDDPATVTLLRMHVGAALWRLRLKGAAREGDYKG